VVVVDLGGEEFEHALRGLGRRREQLSGKHGGAAEGTSSLVMSISRRGYSFRWGRRTWPPPSSILPSGRGSTST
jgi:hypothetical protein